MHSHPGSDRGVPVEPSEGTAPSAALLRDYRRLLERNYTESSEFGLSGPEHGDHGPALERWLAQVAQPWFDAIAAIAAEDGLAVGTYQGFDEYRSGSSPCAFLRSSVPERDRTDAGSSRELPPSDLEAVQAALAKRGWRHEGG
jgi:hypothetical protein